MSKVDKETIIIGGGFYGLSIAIYLHDNLGMKDITIFEKEIETMSRASYVNQARVHNGYHYPRSILTGYRSAVNFPNFVEQYKSAIVSNFNKYYAITKQLSKVNAHQFRRFAEKIGVDIDDVDDTITSLFNPAYIEKVFKVKEYAFDSHKLRTLLLEEIKKRKGINICIGERVQLLQKQPDGNIQVTTDGGKYNAQYVINCTYSNINALHRASNLPLVDLKHEIAEMCIIRLPESLKDFSITVMDGPFFSIMPFPSKGLWTLSHVRYTPHESWIDDKMTESRRYDTHEYLNNLSITTNYKQMYNDVIRYIPALKNMEYVESIVEVKTVLVKSEGDDSRPILFKENHGMSNYLCIMGGKLDNIYDVFEALEEVYGENKHVSS